MSSRRKPLKLGAATAAVLCILVFIKCNVSRKAEIRSADLSQGIGSTGSVAHKTWTQYGGGADQSKFVDLDQINKENVSSIHTDLY